MPWADVDFDPFAAPAPRAPPKVSLTVGRNAPPPETIPDAPREDTQPKLAPWAKEVDHIPDFPEPEPETPKEQPGFLETAKRSGELLDADLHRQRSAASQGTTPNLEAHEKNLISDNVMEGDDGNLHYLDSEGRLQPTDTNKHVALKGNDGKIRVYARTPETDEGRHVSRRPAAADRHGDRDAARRYRGPRRGRQGARDRLAWIARAGGASGMAVGRQRPRGRPGRRAARRQPAEGDRVRQR